VVVAGAGPVASCASTLTSNLLFLGSAAGDSLLVRYTSDTPSSLAAGTSHAAGYDRSSSLGGSSNEPPGKRRRLAGDTTGGGRNSDGDAAAAVGGDGFGVSLEDDGEPFRCAMGRSHSAVMPVLLGEGLKQSFKVGGCTSCDQHAAMLYQQRIRLASCIYQAVLEWLVQPWQPMLPTVGFRKLVTSSAFAASKRPHVP
jgi:hypothetical protein